MTRYYCSGCDEYFTGNRNMHNLYVEDASGKSIGKRIVEGSVTCSAGHGQDAIEEAD